MNILHHKSWHIRNKRNIDRVRRDEEKHAKEQDDLNLRHETANRERLHNELRSASGQDSAVNSLLPSAKAAHHGEKAMNLERQKELEDRLTEDKKKLGVLKNWEFLNK